MFRSCGRLIGVSRGTITSRRRSFNMTSAARSTSVRESPCATAASVFIEHGTMTIPDEPWLPLAIAAPRSRLPWSVTVPADTPRPYRSPRYGTSRSTPAASPSSSRSRRRPYSETINSTRAPASRSAASVRVAYNAPLAPVIATMTEGGALSGIQGHDEHEKIENADVSVQVERALHLRQIVG